MTEAKKIPYSKSMLGTKVHIVTTEQAKQKGFEANKTYTGELLVRSDWIDFVCDDVVLVLDVDCLLIEDI